MLTFWLVCSASSLLYTFIMRYRLLTGLLVDFKKLVVVVALGPIGLIAQLYISARYNAWPWTNRYLLFLRIRSF